MLNLVIKCKPPISKALIVPPNNLGRLTYPVRTAAHRVCILPSSTCQVRRRTPSCHSGCSSPVKYPCSTDRNSGPYSIFYSVASFNSTCVHDKAESHWRRGDLQRKLDELMESPPPKKSAYELARDRNVKEVQKRLHGALTARQAL